MTRKCKNQTGGYCHTHVNKVKSVLVGSSKVHKTTQKGGSGNGKIAVIPYQRYNNGGSDQKAAMKATLDANAAQQNAIKHSGGKQNKKTRKVKKIKRRKTKKAKKSKSKKNKLHKKKHYRKKKTKKAKKHLRYKKRGGSSICGSGTPVVVPSFSNGGAPVGPITASKMSGTGNSSNLGAGCQAANDCYATNSCGKSGGGSRAQFKNFYNVFPPGSFGSTMTGPNKKGGYTGDRFPHEEIGQRRD